MDRTRPTESARKKAVRTNITLHPVLWLKAQDIVRDRGFNGLSDYLQACIRKDAGLESASTR